MFNEGGCCRGVEGREGETYEDDLEEHLLVDLHELLVPLLNLGRLLAGVVVVILRLDGIVLVVLAPLDDLAENRLVDLRKEEMLALVWGASNAIG